MREEARVVLGHRLGRRGARGRRRRAVIDVAFRRYNLSLGAGLSKVAGKVFRIGHLGDLNELMVLGAMAGAEMSMLDVGIKIEPGSGVAAAQKYFRTHDNVPKKKVARSEVVYASQLMGSTEGAHSLAHPRCACGAPPRGGAAGGLGGAGPAAAARLGSGWVSGW